MSETLNHLHISFLNLPRYLKEKKNTSKWSQKDINSNTLKKNCQVLQKKKSLFTRLRVEYLLRQCYNNTLALGFE